MKTHVRYFFALGLVALGLLVGSLSPARAIGLSINVGIAPPALPVCVQPACPGLGYIWTPGYWAWDDSLSDYYWVPGTWVLAPEVGYLWTPPWWGCDNGVYIFHDGYWGPNVGFYGGIAYGFGYYGHGYDGGYWRGGHFFYNRSVNNVGALDRSHTFARSVAANNSRVSFNGGAGGTSARATADETRADREHHVAATAAQQQHVRTASADPSLRHSVNHGQPAVTGTARAGEIRSSTERASTGLSHPATAESHVNRTAGEAAFTGERSESHVAAATESHHTASIHAKAVTRTASAESHAPAVRPHVQSHATAAYHPAAHMQAFHAASHAPAFHAASHAPAVHASVSHAVSHGGGGGGGGKHR